MPLFPMFVKLEGRSVLVVGAGSVGESKIDSLLATDATVTIVAPSATEASRAVRQFPLLANVNVVRTWSAIRVMTRDGFPIYDQSESHPGAFTVCCHSGQSTPVKLSTT